MPTIAQVATLITALEQMGWHIERQPEGEPPRTQEIVGFQIDGTTLILRIKSGSETEIPLAAEMARVNLDGEFGIATGEPRRFSVSCFVFSDEKKSRIRSGETAGFLRSINPQQDVGLIFVRAEDAPPGWPIDTETPYGFGKHLTRHGSDDRRWRTARAAQPLSLLPGDVLETGARVASYPRCGKCGDVLIHLAGYLPQHESASRWFSVPALLPLALRAEDDLS